MDYVASILDRLPGAPARRNTGIKRLLESLQSYLAPDQVVDKMASIVRLVQASIQRGIQGTEYADRILAAIGIDLLSPVKLGVAYCGKQKSPTLHTQRGLAEDTGDLSHTRFHNIHCCLYFSVTYSIVDRKWIISYNLNFEVYKFFNISDINIFFRFAN